MMGDVPLCSEDICDFRKERNNSFTVGAASLPEKTGQ